MSRVTEVFASAGELAAEVGELPEALDLLAARLDLAGAGQLLHEITARCWTPVAANGTCPTCGHKGTPDPHQPPTPPPPPPPPPPPGGQP